VGLVLGIHPTHIYLRNEVRSQIHRLSPTRCVVGTNHCETLKQLGFTENTYWYIYKTFNVGVNLLNEGPCLLRLIPSSQKRQQSLRVCLSRDYIYQTEFPEWWFEAHTLFSSSSSFFSPSSFLLPSPLPGGEGPVTELFKTAPPLPKKSPLRLVFYSGGAFGGAFWY